MVKTSPRATPEDRPAWRAELERSLDENRAAPHHRFIQLATLGLDGAPRVRSLVSRGFGEGHSLLFCADLLSEKTGELHAEPRAELCWYLTESREQYRVRGVAEVVTSAEARAAKWRGLSPETQAQFSWPPPGRALGSREVSSSDAPLAQAGGPVARSAEVPRRFVLWRLHAQRVDHLKLGPPAQRVIYELAHGEWRAREVNP